MRARYAAFVRGDAAFLRRSWAPETRPETVALDPERAWTGLTVEAHEITGPDAAVVRFVARWRRGRRKGRVAETSRFRREGADWLYVDGERA